MATTKMQRIGISIILVVTVIGTLGSFAAMILGQENAKSDAKIQQKESDDFQKKYAEYQSRVDAQAVELSAKYYPIFNQYSNRVGSFNMDEAEKAELKTEDLLVGDGEEVTGETKLAAYYIGWLPSGKVFDQSVKNGALSAPFMLTEGLAKTGVIEGWKEGMKGMKIGGVRELTIPSGKAYEERGSQDSSGKEVIPANTPLKFLVMAVPVPEEIPMPEYPPSMFKNGIY